MHLRARQILIKFKAEIVDSLSEGNVHGLLDELSGVLLPEDRQKVLCEITQIGYSWGADTLLDCLKYGNDIAFTKLLKYLQKNRSTEGLCKKISDECIKQRLEHLVLLDDTDDTEMIIKFKSSDEAAKALIANSIPEIVNGLSEGECRAMLRHFQKYLYETDTQKIKCILKDHGKNRAISQMIDSLLPNGKDTLLNFMNYFAEHKKDLLKYIETKLSKYGLQELLSTLGHDECPAIQETTKGDTEVGPDHKPSSNTQELHIPEPSENLMSEVFDGKKVVWLQQ